MSQQDVAVALARQYLLKTVIGDKQIVPISKRDFATVGRFRGGSYLPFKPQAGAGARSFFLSPHRAKFKRYILLTFKREMYKWCSDNLLAV